MAIFRPFFSSPRISRRRAFWQRPERPERPGGGPDRRTRRLSWGVPPGAETPHFERSGCLRSPKSVAGSTRPNIYEEYDGRGHSKPIGSIPEAVRPPPKKGSDSAAAFPASVTRPMCRVRSISSTVLPEHLARSVKRRVGGLAPFDHGQQLGCHEMGESDFQMRRAKGPRRHPMLPSVQCSESAAIRNA